MLRNPDNALLLYVALVIVGFVFGGRWADVRAALTSASQGSPVATGSAPAPTATSGGGGPKTA